MLTRAQSRTPVLLLFILNAIALLFTVGGLAYTVLQGFVGLQMNASTTWACSIYATYKLENSRTYVFDAIFFAAVVALLAEILLLAQLLYLLIKLCKDEHPDFEELTQSVLVRLYIGFSVALLGLMVGVGYYITYIVEQGIVCFGSILLAWLIIGAMFILAFILQLICWIYLFIFKWKVNEKFDKPKQENLMSMEPPPKQVEKMQQPVGMMDLFREMLINNKQNDPDEIKQPLIAEVEEEDRYSEPGECKEKLVHMTYEDYKRKQEEEYKKEIEREELEEMKKKIQQEEKEKKEQEEAEKQLKLIQMKKKISEMALSPNDANFQDIFLESENEEEKGKKAEEQKKKQEQNKASKVQTKEQPKKQIHYPANYVPKDEEDRKKYESFKRRQRENEKANKKQEHYTRHPQNIQGGRSKRLMKRLLHHFKRPHRDQDIYKRDPDEIKEQANSQEQYSSSESSGKRSATFARTKIESPPPPPIISPKNLVSTPKSKKSQPDQLYFHKEKSKSPIRKKLFEQGQSYMGDMNFGSILGTLVKGVIETERHDRLKLLKEKRHMSKPKKNEKLIDFIRSRYE